MTATLAQLRSSVALQMALDRQRMATNLARLREAKRWTQEELEEASGVSERTISRIESPRAQDMEKEIRHKTIEKLAKALGVEPDDVSGGAQLAPEPPTETPDLIGQFNGETQLDRIEEALAQQGEQLKLILAQIDSAVLASAVEEALRASRSPKTAKRQRAA